MMALPRQTVEHLRSWQDGQQAFQDTRRGRECWLGQLFDHILGVTKALPRNKLQHSCRSGGMGTKGMTEANGRGEKGCQRDACQQ